MSRLLRRQIKYQCDWFDCRKRSKNWQSDPTESVIQSSFTAHLHTGEDAEAQWVQDERDFLPAGWYLIVYKTSTDSLVTAMLAHFCCKEHREAWQSEKEEIAEEATETYGD